MMTPSLVQQIQEDIAARLEVNAAFEFVPITIVHPLNAQESTLIQTRIDQQLAGLIPKNGKSGLACLVLTPELAARDVNLPGPQMEADVIVRVIENPLVNRGEGGTRVTPEEQALTALGLLHHWSPLTGHTLYAAEREALRAVEIKDKIAWDAKLRMPLAMHPIPRVPTPVITVDDETHVMTLTGAAAALYYTLNGSLPTAATGTLYTEPVALEGPGVIRIRAVGVSSGMSDSNVKETLVFIPELEP